MRFVSAAGDLSKLQVMRKVGASERGVYPHNGFWALDANEPITFRVLRDGKEILPETTVTPVAGVWVQEVAIP